jgi:anti-anti-sigma regulatory factor
MTRPRTILCDAQAAAGADLGVVEALARLALAARRAGLELALVGVTSELRELIALAGLERVLLGGEALGEPEQREETHGIEEERQLDDGIA